MSVPRSVDLSDSGPVEIELDGGAEVALVVGPKLQTPKDTSTVFVLLFLQLAGMTATGELTITLHRGESTDGPQVGSDYQSYVSSAGDSCLVAVFTEQVSHTDYVQYCAGAQTEAAGTTCQRAIMRCESF